MPNRREKFQFCDGAEEMLPASNPLPRRHCQPCGGRASKCVVCGENRVGQTHDGRRPGRGRGFPHPKKPTPRDGGSAGQGLGDAQLSLPGWVQLWKLRLAASETWNVACASL